MQEMKWRFLRDSLSRSNNYASLHDCIEAVKELEMKVRRCYVESNDMSSNSFVEMMVLDGCFILEYLYKIGTIEYDSIHDAGWSSSLIPNDLILMENQIPFFVLERLYNCVFGEDLRTDLVKFIAQFLMCDLASTTVRPPQDKIHHLLHLCHYYVVPAKLLNPKSPIKPENPKNQRLLWPLKMISQGPKKLLKPCLNLPTVPKPDSSSLYSIPCATQLREAGVKFREKKKPCDILDITFEKGVIEIPLLQVDDNLSIHLMNLTALEQCSSLGVPRIITTYTMFMDAIVNTANDVTILQRNGIINNMVSSEEEVAHLFNQTGHGVVVGEDHYLAELFKKVNKFRKLKVYKYRAKLFHGYLNSPWTILSLAAAVILLLLTSTQTFYAVFAYNHPPS